MRANQLQNQSLYQHHHYLFAYALSRTDNIELAKDLVQETYLSALECQSNFKQRSSVSTWLIAIMKNKICDTYRRLKIEEQKLSELAREPSYEMFNINHELLPFIGKVINKMPPLWQHVFTMKDVEDRPAAEICNTLKLTRANYWVICHRTRRTLRQSLKDFV